VQIESGVDAARQLLRLEARPSAVIASNSKLLLGLLQAFDEEKVKVPQQIQRCRIRRLCLEQIPQPSITTVAQPTFEWVDRLSDSFFSS